MTVNKNLLNARVIRADGTKTFINKLNANGYGTDAKGKQIPVRRLILSGKSLREIEAPMGKDEHAIVDGIAVKLSNRMRKGDWTLDSIRPDFSRLVYIDPETGKPTDKPAKKAKGVKATRERDNDTRSKKDRKAEQSNLKDDLDFIQSDKVDRKALLIQKLDATLADANTKARRELLADAFGMSWKELKAAGGAGVVKQLGRKAVQAIVDKLTATVSKDEFIKQMPQDLKRLIQSGSLTLNKTQITNLLSSMGLDTEFYSIAMQALLGNLELRVRPSVDETEKPAKAAKVKSAKSVAKYLSEEKAAKRIRLMKHELQLPSPRKLDKMTDIIRSVKTTIASQLGIQRKEVKRGLLAYNAKGVELMFVGVESDAVVFVDKKGAATVVPFGKLDKLNLTSKPVSELDAKV